jgi:peptidoglycan/LPS O-acetylase OafA/YrhL
MNLIQKILIDASSHGKSELNRIGYLDGWRGIAITCVLISHFLPIKGLDLGRMGVDIFFVLSGMLMANILFVKRVDLITFYKRRISRIFPVFFIFLSVICLASYMLNLSDEHQNYFYLLSFLRSYFPESPDIWNTGIPIGHLWSLNVEEHYYIFLSFVTLITIFKGKEFIPLILLGVGTIILHYIYLKYPDSSSGLFKLKTEVAASHLFLSSGYFLIKHKFKNYIYSWMPVVAFFLGVLCYFKDAHWTASWMLSPFFFAFAVNHLDMISKSLQQALSNRLLQLLGVYSFSIYLWQQPFYYYGMKFGELFPFAGLVFLFSGIFTGILSFYYIENPIRKYLNNNW